jgi:hypothetical protein
MTLDEFFEAWQALGRPLEAKYRTRCYRDAEGRCPVCSLCQALTGREFPPDQADEAGLLLGLSHWETRVLMSGADNVPYLERAQHIQAMDSARARFESINTELLQAWVVL